jgi:hypothetical protein
VIDIFKVELLFGKNERLELEHHYWFPFNVTTQYSMLHCLNHLDIWLYWLFSNVLKIINLVELRVIKCGYI